LKKPPAKEEKSMEIKKAATAGTLESSDCMVTVEPGEGKIVIHQYGNQLRKVALETLKNLDIDNVRITIVDKGALDCTLKARIEGAVFRSVDQYENLPWGGAIR
jgi:citrate lyase subunit gamma (acyl carrier protein)